MHGAPAVIHPVGRSRFAAALIATLCLASAVGLAMWASVVQPDASRMVAAACAFVAASAIACRGWLRTPQGMLAWDGEGWSVAAGAASQGGSPEAVLDLQSVLLLRWHPHGGPVRWLWAERGMKPSSWDDLRRAVYSRARPSGGVARRARGEGRP